MVTGIRVCPDQAECGELSPLYWKSDKRIHCIKHDSQQAQLHVWVEYGTHVSDTDTCIDGSLKHSKIIWNDSFHHCTGDKSDHLAGPKLC